MAEHVVQSPLPGIFYRSPAPGEPPFAEVGSDLAANQTIGLIEVMKQFAEIKAGVAGRLTGFIVEDNAIVGPSDAIAILETS